MALLAELRDRKVPAVLDETRIWTSSAKGYCLVLFLFYKKIDYTRHDVGLDDDQGERATYLFFGGGVLCEVK